MATDSVTVSPTYNGDSVSLTTGMIVRLKPGVNNNVVRAQADSAPHVQGTNGVVVSGASAPGGVVTVASSGRKTVQMETGLTPAVGDTVYVSATAAGKGTNVAPGVLLPIGVIADSSNYASLGTVETDVICGSSSAGGGGAFPGYGAAPPVVLATKSATGAATTVSRSDHDHGQYMVAQWPQDNPRIYAVDGTNGNDANDGFADAASSSTSDVQAATVAAGLVAKKTLAGLAAIFPRQGSGRTCAVVIARGTYTDTLVEVLNGTTGYRLLVVRGTGTNATAGCTAFDGSTADLIYVGGQTAAGVNANGYNPTGGATTTVIPCQLNGGGAATFAAEPAVPLGCRIRFAVNTATVALRNIAAAIIKVSGSTLTVSTANPLPAVPATNDVFYIEQPGVVCPATADGTFSWDGCGNENLISNYLVGIWMNSGLICPTGSMMLAFFQGPSIGMGTGMPVSIDSSWHLGGAYINVDNTFPRVGGAGRFDGFIGADFAANIVILPSFVLAGTQSILIADVQTFYLGDGAVVSPAMTVGGNKPVISFGGITLGAATDLGEAPLRVLGNGAHAGITLHSFSGNIGGIVITGCGAHPALKPTFQSQMVFVNVVSGSTGNTDVGLDLTSSIGSTIIFLTGVTPTVTGTAGDVRLADGTIISWATAAAGVIDTQGNILFSALTSPLHKTPVAAGAVTVTITNAPAGSGATPARYFKVPDGAGGFYTIPSLT